jgi:DNA-binding protein
MFFLKDKVRIKDANNAYVGRVGFVTSYFFDTATEGSKDFCKVEIKTKGATITTFVDTCCLEQA